MPITGVFAFLAVPGVLLLVPAVPVGTILLARGRKKHALVVLGVPVGMTGLSLLLTVQVFVAAELHSRIVSARPNRLFRATFGFKPPAQTRVLKAYRHSVTDDVKTAMKFRTARKTVDRLTARDFVRCDRETFVRACESNAHHLPKRVRSWLLPPEEKADGFYVAKAFNASCAYSEVILWYEENTQIACFYWTGAD